ncbi:MAG TPA: hypothetical protein VGL89_14135 [Candidatus Koribacter sp.]|jgi:hypothetical protein
MEIKKNIKLSYRIEERPGGGYVARSSDPSQPPMEAASKMELFQKMRERTAAVLGSEIPLDLEHIRVDAKPIEHGTVIDIATKQPQDVTPRTTPEMDARPLAAGASSGSRFWMIAFFLLLTVVLVWYFLHH